MASISDDFSSGTLANWTAALNGAGESVVASQLTGANDGNDHVHVWTAAALAQNQNARVTVITVSAAPLYVRVGVRCTGSGGTLQMYGFYTNGASGAGNTEVDSWTGGAQTVVGNVATTFTTNDILELRVTGSGASISLQPYKNGSPVGSPFTPATQFTTGQPCIGTFNAGVLDTFSAEDDVPLGPTIDTQPSDVIANTGTTANFTVAATTSGGSLTYQWQVSTNRGASYSNVSDGSGGTTTSYTTHTIGFADEQTFYRCAVTDSNGTTNTRGASLRIISVASEWLYRN